MTEPRSTEQEVRECDDCGQPTGRRMNIDTTTTVIEIWRIRIDWVKDRSLYCKDCFLARNT